METFAEHYQSMMDTIQRCMPGADLEIIDRAVEFAREKHKNQVRDGSPYIIHPWPWRRSWRKWGWTPMPFWGLLHDCIEDTDTSHDDIARLFGTTTAELVEGVTKLTRANFSSTEQEQMENLRKMFMAMSKDIRVVLIKIADRLHNMRTMRVSVPGQADSQVSGRPWIFTPPWLTVWVCRRSGWELEDISLKYLVARLTRKL